MPLFPNLRLHIDHPGQIAAKLNALLDRPEALAALRPQVRTFVERKSEQDEVLAAWGTLFAHRPVPRPPQSKPISLDGKLPVWLYFKVAPRLTFRQFFARARRRAGRWRASGDGDCGTAGGGCMKADGGRRGDGAPSFSVVTISFNQAPYLERAIASVVNQRGVALDYVVVDPGSTDGSREIIDRHRDRIATVILERDRGAADGLNNGLAACNGEFFAFVNADDELLPDALAEAAALFAAHPEADVLCGASWQIDEAGRRSQRLVSSRRVGPALLARGVSVVVQQSAFMRTAAVHRAGGFDPDNRTCWDGELFHRMAQTGARFRRVDRNWALFRIYPGSITGSATNGARYRQELDAQFARQFGRPSRPRDRIVARLAWLAQTMLDPVGLGWKLRNRLGAKRG